MSKVHWDGSALMAPLPPALVVVKDKDKTNVLTVGWTGIINSHPPKTYVSIRPERFSYEMLKNSREFTINLPTKDMVKAVDFCGVRSGKNIDKFEKCSLELCDSEKIDTPIIVNSPISLECKVFDIIELGSHDMFMADIVGVDVDEDLINKNGRLRLDKANLIAYSHGEYFEMGARLGSFGFSVKKRHHKSK